MFVRTRRFATHCFNRHSVQIKVEIKVMCSLFVSASRGRVMDGMTEACMKGGIEACYSSVSCACALLSALDELSQGRGIQPEQVTDNTRNHSIKGPFWGLPYYLFK